MARRQRHEEHLNHEAWAIPYGDLITLLLAFFVVMYAISSVNEGKYRILSTALNMAFSGPQRSLQPIQLGQFDQTGSAADRSPPTVIRGAQGPVPPIPIPIQKINLPRLAQQVQKLPQPVLAADRHEVAQAQEGLRQIGDEVERSLGGLIARDLVAIKRNDLWIEVEIKSDILFASGVAAPSAQAVRILGTLAQSLIGAPNGVRVEGHTDNLPIATTQFPSNWELSSARAASVARIFADRGIAGSRLSIAGHGEFQPIADNGTAPGRNANRRVVVVILADLPNAQGGREVDPAELPFQLPRQRL